MFARTARLLGVLALAAPLSCSSTQTTVNTAQSGASQGPVRVFTDSDLITDVAASDQTLYVATYRGIVTYPVAGGEHARITHHDGLPDDAVLAVAVSDDGASLWAATASGVVRKQGANAWSAAGPAQPDSRAI